jgi:hypothetical protein
VVIFGCDCRWLCSSQPVGKRRGEEVEPDRPPSVFFLRRRVGYGGAWWRRAATVHSHRRCPEFSSTVPEAIFVIFKCCCICLDTVVFWFTCFFIIL